MKSIGRNIEKLFAAATFAEAGEQASARAMLRGDRSIALALIRGQDATQAVRYAVSAAQRNNARLDILLIDYGGAGNGADRMALSGEDRAMIGRSSVPFREIDCDGPVEQVLLGHAHREKEVLFFVADPAGHGRAGRAAAASMNRLAETLGRPIVQVSSAQAADTIQVQRGRAMEKATGKQRPVGKMFIMGLISIALYTYLLAHQDQVNSTFGKGGWYAFLPIIVAFVFSFVHGTFTSDFWTVLGIEAARKKKEVK